MGVTCSGFHLRKIALVLYREYIGWEREERQEGQFEDGCSNLGEKW